MHLCGWHPNGKDRCNMPASKLVWLIVEAGEDERALWLCDRHYGDREILAFWEAGGIKPIF